jgi:hypothetical protein
MLVIIALTLFMAIPAFADLQNVVVGGQVRISGHWYSVEGDHPGFNNEAIVEQRTRLNVRADFTDDVSAFIEMDDYEMWGGGSLTASDFRSNYLTGVDSRANTSDDVELYQGYIEANKMFGAPLRLRIGRQELKFGSAWLVGTGESAPYFTGLSFDAVRATYATDTFSVDAFWSKLAETSPFEADGDTDFYGVYASCTAVENVTFDAYWLFVRDALQGVNELHTLGLRSAGKLGGFHFEAEGAYQFGDYDKAVFDVANAQVFAGGHTDSWACNVLAGYFFECTWKPHPFIGFEYFDGGDGDDLAFNRLFSDARLGKTIDSGHWALGGAPIFPNANCSNLWLIHGGVTFNPTEKLMGLVHLCYATENEDDWVTGVDAGHLGWELEASGSYQYSKDLSLEAGYVRLFVDNTLKDGARLVLNGTNVVAVPDDVNYFFFETKISF